VFKILITTFILIPDKIATVYTETVGFKTRELAEMALNKITDYSFTGEYNLRQRAIALYA
jgi:hypothetical protein